MKDMNAAAEQYGGQAAHAARVHGGDLPFTGLDVQLLVLGAILLIIAGLVMSRLEQR